MFHLRGQFAVFISLLVLLLSACSSSPKLMPTPNGFINTPFLESDIPEALRETSMELIYVTDRGSSEQKGVIYDASRLPSIAYGLLIVI
ncbi:MULTISPECIES: hypothetical protein [Alteromonadaceae]|uniref:hypothetical protein n=2 Tax=Alteromonadales TaxID=135622 RepID=UPI00310C45D3